MVAPVEASPNHLVVGYSACWFDGIYPPVSYNYGALTHIVRAFLLPKADGSIAVPAGYWDPNLEKTAHSHGVKLIASLGGAAEKADPWLAMARDPQSETAFFNNLGKMIADNHYDGVDIDWEPSALTDADQATYTDFMKDLRARFPHWIITTALGGGDYWAKHISWVDISKQVDWINWMAYDYAGSWTGHSAHNANLYPPNDCKADLAIDQDLTDLETRYQLSPKKVVLGLPFYGQLFFTQRLGDPFTDDQSKQVSEIQYYEVAPLLAGKLVSRKWDEGAQEPYLERPGGGWVVSYDDPKSIQVKCQYAVKKGLGGVMIWNLGADVAGQTTPLLDAVAQAYGAPVNPMPSGGLTLSLQTFAGLVQLAYSRLSSDHEKLMKAGKSDEAQAVDPGPMPDLTVPPSTDPTVLGTKLWGLEYELAFYEAKDRDGQRALATIPITVTSGQKLQSKGDRLLVDDFESGGTSNALGGTWMTDCDHNHLGTVLNPMPFQPTGGGVHGSKFAAHIAGHYGKSIAPWPYAMLTGTLKASGGAVDLSGFKAVEFWAKGNGKTYSLILTRSAVRDYCNYRQDFKAPTEWTQVTLPFSGFKQPAWGRQVPFGLTDVLYLAFTPNADFNDEDFDLWVDDVTLVK